MSVPCAVQMSAIFASVATTFVVPVAEIPVPCLNIVVAAELIIGDVVRLYDCEPPLKFLSYACVEAVRLSAIEFCEPRLPYDVV